MGQAIAGSAAVAEDASVIYFNPAGLLQLKQAELDIGLSFLNPKATFTNKGSALPASAGGAALTRWNHFQQLAINSLNSTFAARKAENWQNTMRYELGVSYRPDLKWVLRTGVTYDESPIPDPEHRSARISINTVKWVISYQLNENMVFDAAYARGFVSNSPINETVSNGYNLRGDYDAQTNIFAIQLHWLII